MEKWSDGILECWIFKDPLLQHSKFGFSWLRKPYTSTCVGGNLISRSIA